MADEQTSAYITLQLTISAGADGRSRAEGDPIDDSNPWGGEDGNGREYATAAESAVSNATLLLYQADGGINDAGASSIKMAAALDFDVNPAINTGDYDRIYTTEPIQVDLSLISGAYHVIIIANTPAGWPDMSGWTLSAVCDYPAIQQWAERNGTVTDFLMSSEEDAVIDISQMAGSGSKTNPYLMETTIERLAARIDIQPGDGEWDNSRQGYSYTVYDTNDHASPTGDTFILTNIEIVNENLSGGAYLIKRVADDYAGTINLSYLGDETRQAVYVTNADGTQSLMGYAAKNWVVAYNPVSKYTTSHILPVSQCDTGNDYFRVDYLQENTSQTAKTGLRFIGIYIDKDGNETPKTYFADTPYLIRHAYELGTTSSIDPMYHAIVRNNIYRIKITNVLGTSSSQSDPDTSTLELKIIAIPWATYTHDSIQM
ncbi:MAG: hypothetical protein LUD17_12810 [Bacteroidales bacterium]|nr:hypothetical protein [Bacteroidales bacterium]